jgi:phosphate transport system substrate-binding protein
LGYLFRIFNQEKQIDGSRWKVRSLTIVVAVAVLAAGVAACGGSSSGNGGDGSDDSQSAIVGAGSTAQEAVQEPWIKEFESKNTGPQISYEAVGSDQGLERFIAGDAAYAASDEPLEGAELEDAAERCGSGELIEIPVYISPVTVFVNLKLTLLDLSPETLVKVFSGEIAKWDDPVIGRENPTISTIGLPVDLPIAPVYPSDEPGTTESLTGYLFRAIPSTWTYGASSDWPLENGEAAQSAGEVAEAVGRTTGTVGFADSGHAGEAFGEVRLKVGGVYVDPTPLAAARSFGNPPVDRALSKGPYMLPVDLDRRAEPPGSYPVLLVSYMIACTRYDSSAEAAAVRRYLEFVISLEGQELATGEAGSAPLPIQLQKRAQQAAEAIEVRS